MPYSSACSRKTGMGNLFTITWPQDQLLLSLNSTFIQLRGRLVSLDLLSKHLLITELCFNVVLYSNLGNGNSDAGQIKCLRGPRVAQCPTLTWDVTSRESRLSETAWKTVFVACQRWSRGRTVIELDRFVVKILWSIAQLSWKYLVSSWNSPFTKERQFDVNHCHARVQNESKNSAVYSVLQAWRCSVSCHWRRRKIRLKRSTSVEMKVHSTAAPFWCVQITTLSEA